MPGEYNYPAFRAVTDSYYYPPTVFGPLDRVDQLERDEATGKVRECGWCSTYVTRGERHDCPNAPEGTQR